MMGGKFCMDQVSDIGEYLGIEDYDHFIMLILCLHNYYEKQRAANNG